MKNLILLIHFSILFLSCQSQSDEYEFEDQFYECITNENSTINFEKLIVDIENHCKEKGIFEKGKSPNLIQIFRKIKATETFDLSFSLPKDLQTELGKIELLNSNCPNVITKETIDYQNTRSFQIAIGIQKGFNRIAQAEELRPSLLADMFLDVFTEKDLEHPLLKIICLKTFMMVSESFVEPDKGILTKLPPWSEDEPDITKLKARNVLSVLVNSKNEIFIRSKEVQISEIKNIAKEFISNPNKKETLAESPTKGIISLKNDRGTKYKTYLAVLNELKAAYNELRNEKAQQIYGKNFEDLEKDKQKEIRNMIPLVISEAEPTAFGEEK